MKVSLLAFFMMCSIALFAQNQELNLDEDLVRLESGLIQLPDQFNPEPIPHYIEINTVSKRIVVVNKENNEELINLNYGSVYSGVSKSVSMREGETMFMLNDMNYYIATYSQNESTFSFIDPENNILILGQIYYIEEQYRK